VPDDIKRPSPRGPIGGASRAIDLADQAFEFRAAFGHWPRLWVEFQLGIHQRQRAHAAERLRHADAVAAANGTQETWQQWVRDQKSAAGL